MNRPENNLARFNATTLEGLEIIKQLKRYDKKFIFHRVQLIPIFDYLSRHYEVLEIDKNG